MEFLTPAFLALLIGTVIFAIFYGSVAQFRIAKAERQTENNNFDDAW
jgi:hypothetical protein